MIAVTVAGVDGLLELLGDHRERWDRRHGLGGGSLDDAGVLAMQRDAEPRIEGSVEHPLAVNLELLGRFGFWELSVFVGILALGYVYVWKKGALEWRR